VTNPFEGRQYPGNVILQAVQWYLRYPLAYEHVSELLAERDLEVVNLRFIVDQQKSHESW
jgi:transposase-like protein